MATHQRKPGIRWNSHRKVNVQSGMNRLLVLAALILYVAMHSTIRSPQTAHACSLVGLTRESLPALVERTSIIAVGTWTSTSEREATLTVSEGLKGAHAGADLEVDNRQAWLGANCSTYSDSFQDGYRFTEGQRSVVFLEKEVDGLWRVGYFSFAAFVVPDDDTVPLSGPDREPSTGMFSLSELRAATVSDRAASPAEATTPSSALEPPFDEGVPDGGVVDFPGRTGLLVAAVTVVAVAIAVRTLRRRRSWT